MRIKLKKWAINAVTALALCFLFYQLRNVYRVKKEIAEDSHSCTLKVKSYAVKAVNRASTSECKSALKKLGCLVARKNGKIHADTLPHRCPLSGIRNGEMCVCSGELQKGILSLPRSECESKCPGDETVYCGGKNRTTVLTTGYYAKMRKDPYPLLHVPPADLDTLNKKPVRILYLLLFSGRAVRQIKRLLRVLYRRQHYYYIHVDSRSIYLQQELTKVLKSLPNVAFAKERYATIWGGSSMLTNYFEIFDDLFSRYWFWEWDYLINFSESDFPTLPVEDLTAFLTKNYGRNFIQKVSDAPKSFDSQGPKFAFLECDKRLWKVGERQQPYGHFMISGDEWFLLHRKMILLASNKTDKLSSGLRDIYQYSLLPMESFFQVLTFNSEYCESIFENNLRKASWKKAVDGCPCLHDDVVDWCACSPYVFQMEDISKLTLAYSKKNLKYNARKFDSLIDQDILNLVETENLGVSDSIKKHPSWRQYWYCEWLASNPSDMLPAQRYAQLISLAKFGIEKVMAKFTEPPWTYLAAESTTPSSLYLFKPFRNIMQLIIGFSAKWSGSKIEGEILLGRKIEIWRLNITEAKNLTSFQVGTSYDLVKRTFKNYIGGYGHQEKLSAQVKWSLNKDGNYSSGEVRWYGPKGKMARKTQVKAGQISHVEFGSIVGTMEVGIWRAVLSVNGTDLVSTQFLALPFRNDKALLLDDLNKMPWESFYSAENICLTKPLTAKHLNSLKDCSSTKWSSFYPDPKSVFNAKRDVGMNEFR